MGDRIHKSRVSCSSLPSNDTSYYSTLGERLSPARPGAAPVAEEPPTASPVMLPSVSGGTVPAYAAPRRRGLRDSIASAEVRRPTMSEARAEMPVTPSPLFAGADTSEMSANPFGHEWFNTESREAILARAEAAELRAKAAEDAMHELRATAAQRAAEEEETRIAGLEAARAREELQRQEAQRIIDEQACINAQQARDEAARVAALAPLRAAWDKEKAVMDLHNERLRQRYAMMARTDAPSYKQMPQVRP